MATSARAKILNAIDRIDPDLGAWITVDPDSALRRADHDPGGRLRGVTVAVKDLIDTAGLRTTYGSPRYRYHVPVATAPVVSRLEREGAIVLGKTNLNEYAYGVSGYNPHFGLMRTPADPSHTPGGSSGGSAVAVAAGVCDLGIGTDTSGSIRIPAACCGIYGFKCAHGSVSMTGIHPLAPSMDSVGYFARDLDLIRLVLRIAELPTSAALRVADIDEVAFPEFPADAHWTMFRDQSHRIHQARARSHPDEYGDDLHVKLSKPVGDVALAEQTMRRWREDVELALEAVDLVVMPVFKGEAPTVDEVMRDYHEKSLDTSDRMLGITPIVSALGWPALALPTADGPRQIVGRRGSEAQILAWGTRVSSLE